MTLKETIKSLLKGATVGFLIWMIFYLVMTVLLWEILEPDWISVRTIMLTGAGIHYAMSTCKKKGIRFV